MKNSTVAPNGWRWLKSQPKTILGWRGAALSVLIVLSMWGGAGPQSLEAAAPVAAVPEVSTQADDPSKPSQPVKLIFIHHSTGENWLNDGNGQLGLALRDNNYFVSDTNYGWGSTGDYTDIGNWYDWFGSGRNSTVLSDLYAESGQNSSYSRLATDPGGPNEIILFKSCFPNSALKGSLSDPIPPIDSNPLKGRSSGSSDHTVSNAKGIYLDLLPYFASMPGKLFVVITAPPLIDGTYAANARAFNEWLVDKTNGWLKDYTLSNVAVFDFYNVLTTNGGAANRNDVGQAGGNHHRWWNGAVQHKSDAGSNVLAYRTGDDHPSAAGGRKATAEFVPLLNVFYHRWKNSGPGIGTPETTATQNMPNNSPEAAPTQILSANTPVTATCPCSIWTDGDTPDKSNGYDGSATQAGTKFRSAVDGFITGLKFYKGDLNTGTHTGQLYTRNGTLLAEAVFTNETASGWQTVYFATPVTITAGTTYIASYHSASGYYAVSYNYFAHAISRPPLTALADGTDGPNSVYRYSAVPAFPTNSYEKSNYWVDVVFETTAKPGQRGTTSGRLYPVLSPRPKRR